MPSLDAEAPNDPVSLSDTELTLKVQRVGREDSVGDRKWGVSILLCKRPGFVFGMGAARKGNVPSLAQPCRKSLRSHDAILSTAGIRSGHRIVKWFKASRQWWIGIVHFFAACRSARNSNFNAASSLGNPPRVLMIA